MRAACITAFSRLPKAYFDSFSTELGWMGDSFWSYLSVDGDLPYASVTWVGCLRCVSLKVRHRSLSSSSRRNP
jgi:hypothetical protein